METNQAIPEYFCPSCSNQISADSRFCPHCGAYQQATKQKDLLGSFELKALLLYYFITLIICLVVKLDTFVDDVGDLFVMDIIDGMITIAFAATNFRSLRGLFSFRRVKPLLLLATIPAAFVCAYIINVLVDGLNRSLFESTNYYFYFYQSLENPIPAMIISIALYPAIFEELAFRGFLHNYSLRLFGPQATLILISFLFALMHLSLIGFIWLFPFGWLLAYMRQRYQTLWYGIFFHFVFNLTAIFYELWAVGYEL